MRTTKLFLAVALFVCPLVAQVDPFWVELEKGNRQFMTGSVTFTGLTKLREDLAKEPPGQEPPYAILACSDSRVPPELVFAQTLGQLFVVRAAGNIADGFALASLEYAVSKKWTKRIVVLGHAQCGAVERALDPTSPGSPHLVALVNRIRESFGGIEHWRDPRSVRPAIEANARLSAAQLVANSQIIRDAVLSGSVKVFVAYYDFETGKVECLNCPGLLS